MSKNSSILSATAAALLMFPLLGNAVMAGESPDRMVTSGKDNIKVTVQGHVNSLILYGDDGDERDEFFFSDGEQSKTRFSFNGKGKLNEDLSIGARIEVGLRANSSDDVTFEDGENDTGDANAGTEFQLRHTDVFFDSKSMGKFSLGQGSVVSDGVADVDNTGTYMALPYFAGYIGGDFDFFDKTADAPSGNRIDQVAPDIDGGRAQRIRYDSPSFGGAKLSFSLSQLKAYETALRYSAEVAGMTFAGAVAYVKNNSTTSGGNTGNGLGDEKIVGSFTLGHSSGVSFMFAGADVNEVRDKSRSGDDDAYTLYFKLGYKTDLTNVGTTAFGIDYTIAEDYVENHEYNEIGLGVVQNIDVAATELYAGVRFDQLDDDTNAADYEDITVAYVGARVKF